MLVEIEFNRGFIVDIFSDAQIEARYIPGRGYYTAIRYRHHDGAITPWIPGPCLFADDFYASEQQAMDDRMAVYLEYGQVVSVDEAAGEPDSAYVQLSLL